MLRLPQIQRHRPLRALNVELLDIHRLRGHVEQVNAENVALVRMRAARVILEHRLRHLLHFHFFQQIPVSHFTSLKGVHEDGVKIVALEEFIRTRIAVLTRLMELEDVVVDLRGMLMMAVH